MPGPSAASAPVVAAADTVLRASPAFEQLQQRFASSLPRLLWQLGTSRSDCQARKTSLPYLPVCVSHIYILTVHSLATSWLIVDTLRFSCVSGQTVDLSSLSFYFQALARGRRVFGPFVKVYSYLHHLIQKDATKLSNATSAAAVLPA